MTDASRDAISTGLRFLPQAVVPRAAVRRATGKVFLAGAIALSTALAGISASAARGGGSGASDRMGMMGMMGTINKPPRPVRQ